MPNQLTSTFDSGKEGWSLLQPDNRSRLRWGEDGGDPGGFLRYNDPGHENFQGTIVSPAALACDRSGFIDGTLSFDLYSPERPAFISVILYQSDGRSVFAYAYPTGTYDGSTWNHYSLDLNNDTFVGDAFLIEYVLSDLDSIQILPRYGSSGAGIDNIALTKPSFDASPELAAAVVDHDTSYGAAAAASHAPMIATDGLCALV